MTDLAGGLSTVIPSTCQAEAGCSVSKIPSLISRPTFVRAANCQAFVYWTKARRLATIPVTSPFNFMLPIIRYAQQIRELVANNRVVIIAGQTGSGKTTQVPQFLKDYKICISQPRRISAISLAQRVADECNVQVGREVGYSVRFQQKRSDKTKLLFATDGMALREIMIGRYYQLYIVDQAHERSLASDVLLAMLKQLSLVRDFKIIVMSATLQVDKFFDFFGDAAYLGVEGRTHPIRLFYTLSPVADYVQATMNAVLQIAFQEGQGHILAFLTGQEQIDFCCQQLSFKLKSNQVEGIQVMPLYSALPTEQQLKIFKSQGDRKIILTTNVAETAITIPGVVFVVDCGLTKIKVFDPTRNCEVLLVVPASRSNCVQRAGRAGRTGPGKCFRLFTQESYDKMAQFQAPQILRSNLQGVILQMKSMGVKKTKDLQLIDRPQPRSFQSALEKLMSIGALDQDQALTELGREMSVFPIQPLHSYILIKSVKFKCTDVVLTVLALLAVQSLLYVESGRLQELTKVLRRFAIPNSDHLTRANLVHSYLQTRNKGTFLRQNFINKKALDKVLQVRKQLADYLKSLNYQAQTSPTSDLKIQLVRKFLLEHLSAAKRDPRGKGYLAEGNVQAKLHPESVVSWSKQGPERVVYSQLVQTKRMYLRIVTGQQ